jgi:hypothetical protein
MTQVDLFQAGTHNGQTRSEINLKIHWIGLLRIGRGVPTDVDESGSSRRFTSGNDSSVNQWPMAPVSLDNDCDTWDRKGRFPRSGGDIYHETGQQFKK